MRSKRTQVNLRLADGAVAILDEYAQKYGLSRAVVARALLIEGTQRPTALNQRLRALAETGGQE